MNPVPFVLYREQLLKLASATGESPKAADEPVVTETAPRAARPQSAIEIAVAGVVLRIGHDTDHAQLVEVLRAVRCSALSHAAAQVTGSL